MNARVLPPEEWKRMERAPVMAFPFVRPENIDIVVVEDNDEIVACLTILKATHFEGVWIDPKHRNAGVTRALLRLAYTLTRIRGEKWVFGGAEHDQMRGLMDHLGAVKVPMDLYALFIGGEECRPQ